MLYTNFIVSILTRPEGRVQRVAIPYRAQGQLGFNPHPSRRTGATDRPFQCGVAGRGFNPHPSRRTGATDRTAINAYRFRSFNPHPSRRTGATLVRQRFIRHLSGFNPHPSRRTGATVAPVMLLRDTCFNPHPSRRTGATAKFHTSSSWWKVSILTRPEGRVQPCLGWRRRRQAVKFQSSPVPKDGCNAGCRA